MYMLVMSVLGMAIYGTLFYFVFYKFFYKTLFKSFKGAGTLFAIGQEEKRAFQQMMFSPTNETVSGYIKVIFFKLLNNRYYN